jgi:hypothetical protein
MDHEEMFGDPIAYVMLNRLASRSARRIVLSMSARHGSWGTVCLQV